MKYPSMNRVSHYRVNVPQLNGGTNRADAIQRVEDNQLTDGLNLWWHENGLCTRPGLNRGAECFGDSWSFTQRQTVNEQESFLVHWNDMGNGEWLVFPEMLSLRESPSYTPHGTGRFTVTAGQAGGFLVEAPKGADTEWYFFTEGGVFAQEPETDDPGLPGFKAVEEVYVPTVLVNGKGDADESGAPASAFEGYNLLTGAFRAMYTTDGRSSRFSLPRRIPRADGSQDGPPSGFTVTVTLPTDSGAARQYTLTAQGSRTTNRVSIDRAAIGNDMGEGANSFQLEAVEYDCDTYSDIQLRFYANGDFTASYPLEAARSSANNLIIQADGGDNDHQRILGMRRCCWFGGDRSGYAGGTRLFLCGNGEHPNLIHWSDVNRPLYFPENNYAYIGGTGQAVTGFGRQGELLLIFKESELYAAQYVAGTAYTAADVEEGNVIDVTTASASFPITPIHPNIGSDCPDTVRLVNNRLCWADSRGFVYMLPTVNQYNERVVREIGGNIRRSLTRHSREEWRQAQGCEFFGHYMLTVGTRAYLLETNNSSFSSYTYYAKESTAQRLLPWYIWEFPSAPVITVGDREQLKMETQGFFYTLDGDTDDGAPIHSFFETKLFDFGSDQRSKAIHQLYISMADAGGRVRVSYITEAFTAEDAYLLESTEAETPYTAGYFRPFRLSPNLHRVREFGLRLESEGEMRISGITIDYSLQGGTR